MDINMSIYFVCGNHT